MQILTGQLCCHSFLINLSLFVLIKVLYGRTEDCTIMLVQVLIWLVFQMKSINHHDKAAGTYAHSDLDSEPHFLSQFKRLSSLTLLMSPSQLTISCAWVFLWSYKVCLSYSCQFVAYGTSFGLITDMFSTGLLQDVKHKRCWKVL